MFPPQHYDGHLLPLRLECQVCDVCVYYIVLDAKHRDVTVPSDNFWDWIGYVQTANASMVWPIDSVFDVIRDPVSLTIPERLAPGHPADGQLPLTAFALECAITGFTNWIGDAPFKYMQDRGWLDESRQPREWVVDRWYRWRKLEDAAVARLNIRRTEPAIVRQFRQRQSYLTVVQ